jgi:hypothetical protein
LNKKWLLFFILMTFILSIPSVWTKMETEKTAKTVEFSFDYLSLLSLSEQLDRPNASLDKLLVRLKDEGFSTLTLPNNTFYSLEQRGYVSVLSSDEFRAIRFMTNDSTAPDLNQTYVMFHDEESIDSLKEIIYDRFRDYDVSSYELNGKEFIGLNAQLSTFLHASIPFLESDMKLLTNEPYNFSLILKIDNKWNGQEWLMTEQLKKQDTNTLSKIYFADSGVLGFPTNHTTYIPLLPNVPFSYKEYFTAGTKQKGINLLASERNNQIVRLHTISDTMFIESFDEPEVLIGRIVKAVKERNIRSIHVQLPLEKDGLSATELFEKNLHILVSAKNELEKDGFLTGISKPITNKSSEFSVIGKWMALLSGVAIIVWTLSIYLPKWITLFIGGAVPAVIITFLVGGITSELLALLIVIFLPLGSVTWLIKRLQKKETITLVETTISFIITVVLSIAGGLLISGIHYEIEYLLYLERFKGVSIAHFIPPLILMFFLLLHHDMVRKDTALRVLNQPIRIYQIVVIGFIGAVAYYYLSRTGNQGVLMPFESEFRSFMEESLGVRPRTKEFLIAHPFLVLIIFYWKRMRLIKWFLPFALIGQISIVNTFTHFHTPTMISIERSINGMWLGLLIGLLLIILVETGTRIIKDN